MPDRFVTIGRFSLLPEAQLARSRLERDNIRAWIVDDSVSGSLPGLGDTVGGISLQTHEADYDRADTILAQFLADDGEAASVEDVRGWTCPVCDEAIQNGVEICPSCGEVKGSIGTRSRTSVRADAAAVTEEDDDDDPTNTMERSPGKVITSRGFRRVAVAMLLGPDLVAFALLFLGLCVLGLLFLLGRLR